MAEQNRTKTKFFRNKDDAAVLVSTMSTKMPSEKAQEAKKVAAKVSAPISKISLPKKTTDYNGYVMLIKQPKQDLPLLPRRSPLKIADITDGEVIKSELHNRQRVVTQGFEKKNKPFKDQSKIVTEEFDPELNTVPEESSVMLNVTSKDLECL